MQFNSYIFILCFLPTAVLLYHLSNLFDPLAGKIFLIVAGIVFYANGKPESLACLGISLTCNYLSAWCIRRYSIRHRLLRALPIIVNIGILIYFKYMNFVITNVNALLGTGIAERELVLPLGISFFTFQQIAYVVEVERGNLEDVSLVDYLAYILFFPKLVMGPLADPVDLITQFNDRSRKKFSAANLAVGLKIFSLGLLKKTLIADTFARAVEYVSSNPETSTSMDCLLMILFFTLEIYFDFSGYSDMAVGAASMLNIDLPMNFDSPYKAVSIRDFWKRWHISLTGFLTRYVYIPLGGSRKGKRRVYINTMIVFLVSGLWHGANWTFVLWGLLHGSLSCLDRALDKTQERIRPGDGKVCQRRIPAWQGWGFQNITGIMVLSIRWLCTFCSVSLLWLLFRSESVAQWIGTLKKAAGLRSAAVSQGLIDVFNMPEVRLVFSVFRPDILSEKAETGSVMTMIIFTIAALCIVLFPGNNYRNKDRLGAGALVLASVSFVWGILCLGTESVFLYFGF